MDEAAASLVVVMAGEKKVPPLVVAAAATVAVLLAVVKVVGKLNRGADEGAGLSFTELAKDGRPLDAVTSGVKGTVVETTGMDDFEAAKKLKLGVEDTVVLPPEAVDFAKAKVKPGAEDVTTTLDAEVVELANEKAVPPKLVCPKAEVDLASGSVKGRAVVEVVVVEDPCSPDF